MGDFISELLTGKTIHEDIVSTSNAMDNKRKTCHLCNKTLSSMQALDYHVKNLVCLNPEPRRGRWGKKSQSEAVDSVTFEEVLPPTRKPIKKKSSSQTLMRRQFDKPNEDGIIIPISWEPEDAVKLEELTENMNVIAAPQDDDSADGEHSPWRRGRRDASRRATIASSSASLIGVTHGMLDPSEIVGIPRRRQRNAVGDNPGPEFNLSSSEVHEIATSSAAKLREVAASPEEVISRKGKKYRYQDREALKDGNKLYYVCCIEGCPGTRNVIELEYGGCYEESGITKSKPQLCKRDITNCSIGTIVHTCVETDHLEKNIRALLTDDTAHNGCAMKTSVDPHSTVVASGLPLTKCGPRKKLLGVGVMKVDDDDDGTTGVKNPEKLGIECMEAMGSLRKVIAEEVTNDISAEHKPKSARELKIFKAEAYRKLKELEKKPSRNAAPVIRYEDSAYVKKPRQMKRFPCINEPVEVAKVREIPPITVILKGGKRAKSEKKSINKQNFISIPVEDVPEEAKDEDVGEGNEYLLPVKRSKRERVSRLTQHISLWKDAVEQTKEKRMAEERISKKRAAKELKEVTINHFVTAPVTRGEIQESKAAKRLKQQANIKYKGEVLKPHAEDPFGHESQFLIESGTCRLYQRIYASSVVPRKEVLDEISIIGTPVYSNDWFMSGDDESSSYIRLKAIGHESPLIADSSDPVNTADDAAPSSQFGQEITDEHIPPGSGSSIIPPEGGMTSRGKRKPPAPRIRTISSLYQELTKPNLNPHMLVTSLDYGMPLSEDNSTLPLTQPFVVEVHPQVDYLCDVHAHLCEAEVIGLLAGRWDAARNILFIQAAFPCTSTDRHDDGSTDVELDAVAEYEVRRVIEGLNLVVVGWYHSHPKFRPDPSVTDIFNQSQYQSLMRDESSGLEPFVGLICSTFDPELPSAISVHKWFHTRLHDDGRGPVSIPFQIHAHTRIYHPGRLPLPRHLLDTSMIEDITVRLLTGDYVDLDGASSVAAAETILQEECHPSKSCEQTAAVIEEPEVKEEEDAMGSGKRKRKSSLSLFEPGAEKLLSKRGRRSKTMPTMSSEAATVIDGPSLLGYLRGSGECETMARRLVSAAAPHLRCCLLTIAGIALYYSQNVKRVSLQLKWKSIGSKLDKIRLSSSSYLRQMGLDEAACLSLAEEVAALLQACWIQLSPLKLSKQRQLISRATDN